jgi:hypothetical protein
VVLHLVSSDTKGDAVAYAATAVSATAALQQQYQFTPVGLYGTKVDGVTTQAYVLYSAVPGGAGGYYLLSSTGGLYAYDGSGSFANTFADEHNQIAQLSATVFNTPILLTQPTPVVLPANVVSVNNSVSPATLTLNVAGLPAGTLLEVFVTASDGAETTKTGFLVTVTH